MDRSFLSKCIYNSTSLTEIWQVFASFKLNSEWTSFLSFPRLSRAAALLTRALLIAGFNVSPGIKTFPRYRPASESPWVKNLFPSLLRPKDHKYYFHKLYTKRRDPTLHRQRKFIFSLLKASTFSRNVFPDRTKIIARDPLLTLFLLTKRLSMREKEREKEGKEERKKETNKQINK